MHDASDHSRPPARSVPPLLSAMLRGSDGILDMLPIATFICDAKGTILQYNRRAAEIWGSAPEPGQTHDEFSASSRFFDPDGRPVARSLLADVLASGQPVRDAERRVMRADGTQFVVSVNIDPLRNAKGELVGAVNCFTDITERRRMDAALEESRRNALEQEQRLAATYEHAAIGIAEIAPDGRYLRVNEAMCAITGYGRDELLAIKLFSRTHADDVDADCDAFRKQLGGALDFYSIEKRIIHKDGRVIWLSVRSSPVRTGDGRLLYVVRVVQDITERKDAERRQKLLIDELNHRVKNTLATVQSLASRTARGAPTPQAFRERFEGRLIALSKAHDQLTRSHWESADLRELLSGSLAPYCGPGPKRVVLRGEDFVLRPRAVLALAMAVHELTTNAAKYGALSAPGGRIEIRWQPVWDESGHPLLRIDWIEQSGPKVSEPQERGFGSRLIEGSIAAELGGQARLAFEPSGLRCEITIPLEAATADVDRGPPAGKDWSI
jgi:PAS domain S-box-containing protein